MVTAAATPQIPTISTGAIKINTGRHWKELQGKETSEWNAAKAAWRLPNKETALYRPGITLQNWLL